MKIKIEHLGYTIYVRDVKKAKGEAKDFLNDGFLYCARRLDKDSSEIYIPLNPKPKDFSSVAHEVVHILGYICRDRGISFINEEEHMAYLMQYILNKIFGYEYDI